MPVTRTEMADAARASGCHYTVKYRQMDAIEKEFDPFTKAKNPLYKATSFGGNAPNGICWGLAFVWMEYKAKRNYSRFFNDIDVLHCTPTLAKAPTLQTPTKVSQPRSHRHPRSRMSR